MSGIDVRPYRRDGELTPSAARYAKSATRLHAFRAGQAVRYKPGFGTYGYDAAVEADGRIPAVVVLLTTTRVRIRFEAIPGGAPIERAVDATSLIRGIAKTKSADPLPVRRSAPLHSYLARAYMPAPGLIARSLLARLVVRR